ncbi:hypothetical protein PVA44_04875 [Entomospira nematocerorum]|uniref:Uncharacterized protein n=1 Tax=Entomospira nematocerorum TaxID=2719987 RepID=A0A968GF57_9SPIO|nr:hypothetical protein [Entomospira nematocera]NIZ46646.1 hypothetical protein [Entomospira nematocera]WDI33556.1 hypothetical protein PVA44_04875 [Entomospira nematocera]
MKRHMLNLIILMSTVACHQSDIEMRNSTIANNESSLKENVGIEIDPQVVSDQISRGQIFSDENAMLVALQGSWAWQEEAHMLPQRGYQWYAREPYFHRYDPGFTVSYLFISGSGSLIENNVPYTMERFMDLDMSKLQIDLIHNTLTIGSYYVDDYRLIFQFLSADSLIIREEGSSPFLGYQYVYEGSTIYDEDGELVIYPGKFPSFSWAFEGYITADDLRIETPTESREDLNKERGYSFFFGRDGDLDPIKQEYIFVRVDGFEYDAQYNIYDKEGVFLMNPEMIRSSSIMLLPNKWSLQ